MSVEFNVSLPVGAIVSFRSFITGLRSRYRVVESWETGCSAVPV